MEGKFYTDERGQQILMQLMKSHGIRKVIASPGTTNYTLVASMQQDPYFQIYSSVDERSAAYIACGMAAECGEPVALSCTGATASRNYMPALTEAYYRKLPILAITSTQGNHKLGNLIAQNIDRRVVPNDVAKMSVYVPNIQGKTNEHEAEVNINKALLELRHHGGGPVHINLATCYSKNFSVKELPTAAVIHRIMPHDTFPDLRGKVAVVIGSHAPFSAAQTRAIDAFCATYDAIAFADHTSGYKGRYRALSSIVNGQKMSHDFRRFDVLVHIGEVSGDYGGTCALSAQEVWRVSEDGEIRDQYGSLRYVFEMREQDFFLHYAQEGVNKNSQIRAFHSLYQSLLAKIPDLPFSNIWLAQQMAPHFPPGSTLHIGILNSLRAWDLFELPETVQSFCNVGGFGIDGNNSSMLGASMVSPDKLFFEVVGDLAFFYDLNSLGNRHVGPNVRILLVNNGMGTEFRLYSHPWGAFGEHANAFGSAAGHFGNKSPQLIRHYAEDLGYEYITASTKEEVQALMPYFLSPVPAERPIVFEVFTNSQDESDALYAVNNLESDMISNLADGVRKMVGQQRVEALKGVGVIRKILKR